MSDPLKDRSSGMKCTSYMCFVEKIDSTKQDEPAKTNPRVIGRCRRHSPTMCGYPVVPELDWCGDHKLDENKG